MIWGRAERQPEAKPRLVITDNSQETEQVWVGFAHGAAGTVPKRSLAPGEPWRI
jgi:hypothetical protein